MLACSLSHRCYLHFLKAISAKVTNEWNPDVISSGPQPIIDNSFHFNQPSIYRRSSTARVIRRVSACIRIQKTLRNLHELIMGMNLMAILGLSVMYTSHHLHL